MKVEVLPIDVIELPEWAEHVRLRCRAIIDALKASIGTLGFTVPILVARTSEGSYVIIDGITRYLAAKELGLQHVPAYIWPHGEYEAEEAFLIALRLNTAQKGMGPVSKARAVAWLLARGWKVEDACRAVGISESRYREIRKLLELPREVQERVELGEVSVSAALGGKGVQPTYEPSELGASYAGRAPSSRRRSDRSLECAVCGKPVKAHERKWLCLHDSCWRLLNAVLSDVIYIVRDKDTLEFRCRRCKGLLAKATWNGVRWLLQLQLGEE